MWKYLGLIFLTFSLNAQNYDQDILEMFSKTASKTVFGLKGNIKVFSTPTSQPMTSSIELKRSGENSYYKVFGNEMVFNHSLMVMLDHSDKTLVVRPISKKERKAFQMKFEYGGDTSLQTYDSVRYEKVDQFKRYKVFFKSEDYHYVELYLTKENVLSRVVYWHKSTEENGNVYKSEISYTFFEIDENDPILKMENYVAASGKTYKGIGKYSGYEVVFHQFE